MTDAELALLREVHVYGVLMPTGEARRRSHAQNIGLGARLVRAAESLARDAGCRGKPGLATATYILVQDRSDPVLSWPPVGYKHYIAYLPACRYSSVTAINCL